MQVQQTPLALDYHAHGQASGWRRGEDLIDALPYIDPIPPHLKPQVDALIEEEKQRSTKTPAEYLRELPPVPPPRFQDHPILQAEYERVKAKLPMQPLDNIRYRLDPPPQSKRGDVSAWKQSLDNAGSQLEHQYLRILNQELLLKHGDKAWRAQVQLDEALMQGQEQELAALKKEAEHLNRERKLQQMAAGAELSKLEQDYHQTLQKNFEIDNACGRLEDEVHALEGRLQQRIAEDTQAHGPTPSASTLNPTLYAAMAAANGADGQQDGPQEGSGEQVQANGGTRDGDGNAEDMVA